VQVESEGGSSSPTVEDAQAWATEYDLTGPILLDEDYALSQHFVGEEDGKLEVPRIAVVAHDGEILAVVAPGEEDSWLDVAAPPYGDP
jgi:hypothetical protein